MLVAVLAFLASAAPAFASHLDDIDIDIDSDAYVYNYVETVANTGSNDANGGNADSDVYSGNIDDDNDDSNTGNEDNDATGGDGGTNNTGNAWANSDVLNDVNYNDVDVDTDCDCTDDINIDIDNYADVYNYVYTTANTGSNDANGGNADSYISSGNIDDDNWDSNTGNEDNDASGGDGGGNNTGDADAESVVTNVVNFSIVRVTRN